MAQDRALMPSDIRDPNFARDMNLWASQMQCEIHEIVMASKATIAATRDMIAEADRILARKQPVSIRAARLLSERAEARLADGFRSNDGEIQPDLSSSRSIIAAR